jgi:hypothetical protein
MAASDAMPVPKKNVAFRVTFDLRLNTGGVSSGAAGLDSEVSKDGGTFTDCTNEATEIATSSGIYFLDLTSTEMNADTVAIQVKSSTSGAITRVIVLYPQNAGDIMVDVDTIKTSATAATAQRDLADSASLVTVDSATYTPTAIDFECSLADSTITDFYKGRSVVFVTGTLSKQAARITGSVWTGNSKTKLTVTSLTAAPANGATCRLV